jgi:hypothetical protein
MSFQDMLLQCHFNIISMIVSTLNILLRCCKNTHTKKGQVCDALLSWRWKQHMLVKYDFGLAFIFQQWTFCFPFTSSTCVFRSEPKIPLWKVVFHKKPRNRKVATNTFDDYIDTHDVVSGLEPPLEFLDMKSNKTLVGAIKLNREKRLFGCTSFAW